MLSRKFSLSTLAALASMVGCATAPNDAPGDDSLGMVQSPVIAGTASDSSQDSVVLLVHYDPTVQGVGSCTGTLVAPNLILTARHCVADTDEAAACAADGTPIGAGAVRKNHPPKSLYAFTGAKRPRFESGDVKPAGQGLQVFDDGAKNLCNHDIALVLLQKPIKDAKISPIRLDGDATVGETFTAVGWGVTKTSPFPMTRQQRKDLRVKQVGPGPKLSGLPPNEFEVGESICSGDSGGPAISAESNAVFGIVSRGGNLSEPDPNNPAANCIGAHNLYTKVAPFKDLIMKAFAAAEAEPWLEGGPDPRKAKAKEACSTGDDCRSALCLPDPDLAGQMTCAEDCSSGQACSVAGNVCTSEGSARVCRAPKPETSTTTVSCTAAPRRSIGGMQTAVAVGLVALAGLRRRKRFTRLSGLDS